MGRITFIDQHAARHAFGRRNPQRSRILRAVAEIEQVLRLGFDLKGRPHAPCHADKVRLAEIHEAMSLHLVLNPELQ